MRIIYRLVEFAQCELEGLLIKDHLCKLEHNLRHVDITLPTRSVLPEGSKHYEQVRKAVLALMSEKIEIYDSESRTWKASPLVYNVVMRQGEGKITLSVADFVWTAMLDFTHGFRQYELATVLSLKSASSMKMYTLISGQRSPIYYTMEKLRKIFGVEGKYTQSYDFIKKVIKPAQAELGSCCPWTFTFHAVKESRAFVGITFFPVEQPELADATLKRKQLLAQVDSSLLFSDVFTYMRYNMGFGKTEINANKALLEDAMNELPDFMGLLSSIQGRRRAQDGTERGKGWVIAAIKSELKYQREGGR